MHKLVFLLLLLFSITSYCAASLSDAEQQRFDNLTQQLRCLVCQNQSIADSNAPLAQDLRQEVARLFAQGYTDEQVVDYLVQRYGQFILYKPQLNKQTALLWFGPVGLLLLAFGILGQVIVKRKR